VIAPFDYTHMFWAVMYGYLFWGSLPALSTWIGTTIIMGSGSYIIFREHRSHKNRKAIIANSSLTSLSLSEQSPTNQSEGDQSTGDQFTGHQPLVSPRSDNKHE
jgi:hypothetical protein